MKKKTLTLLVFSCSLLTSFAQTAKEEIYADILKSGSNYMAYQAPTKALTKAPKGYEPFYMSHYGRHGSRWLINENDYTSVIRVFRRANELGKLTPLGKEALAKLERFIPTTKGRLGELSDIGEQQHHGIGRRMTENFPEIFSGKDAEVDARSTVVVRCILSMTAECEELTAFNPKMKMHNDVSESYQYYLNHNFSQRLKDASRDRGSIVDEYKKKYTHPERFCRALFNDESYWKDEDFRPRSFMRAVFNVITNMQSHGNGEDMWNLFTTEECYDLWKIVNIPAPQHYRDHRHRHGIQDLQEWCHAPFRTRSVRHASRLSAGTRQLRTSSARPRPPRRLLGELPHLSYGMQHPTRLLPFQKAEGRSCPRQSPAQREGSHPSRSYRPISLL